MLVIERNGTYISEKDNEYVLTTDKSKAIDFKWFGLFFNKKLALEGINNKFGNGFSFKKV